MREAIFFKIRSFSLELIAVLPVTCQLTETLLLVLLTCCPPAPPDLLAQISSSWAGMRMPGFINRSLMYTLLVRREKTVINPAQDTKSGQYVSKKVSIFAWN